MVKQLQLVGIALFATAFVPISQQPPAASEQALPPDRLDDCAGGYLDVLLGQKASDPTLSSLPGYIDIIGAASNLAGETLTAIFYLREIPEEMAVNREGVEDLHMEYMRPVSIVVDGGSTVPIDSTDFTIATFHAARSDSADAAAAVLPFRVPVQTMVWNNKHSPGKNETHLRELPVIPRLIVSREDDTLTLVGRIPGTADSSIISFSTFDALHGRDGVSCRPG